MIAHRPRLITRFTSDDGSDEVVFPESLYEWESSQDLRTAFESAIGASYAVDLLGKLPAAREVARERIRCLAVGDDGAALDGILDQLRAVAYRAGAGRLWAESASGDSRWARARLASMPDVTITYEGFRTAPVICEFARNSPWYATSATVVTATNPTSLSATNTGTADAGGLLFEITANGSGGWANPRIENALTGEWWQVSRSAASGEILRVDTGRMAVETSTDGGATWVSAHPDLTTGDTLIGFLRLLPGGQTLSVSGCGNATVSLRFTAAWL